MCNRTVVDVQQKTSRVLEAYIITLVVVHYNASSRAAERWYTCIRMLVGVQQNGGWLAFDLFAADGRRLFIRFLSHLAFHNKGHK